MSHNKSPLMDPQSYIANKNIRVTLVKLYLNEHAYVCHIHFPCMLFCLDYFGLFCRKENGQIINGTYDKLSDGFILIVAI